MIDNSRDQLLRQLNHWALAAERLGRLDDHAAPAAWAGLETYLGVRLRQHLAGVASRLQGPVEALRRAIGRARTEEEIARVQGLTVAYRTRYLRAETTVDFFVDAINTRTNPRIAAILRACDHMAAQAMRSALDPLGLRTPPVLTYLDRGLGASVLKSGQRLWDGGELNPVAAVKIVRHNVFRTTALIHESGHQFAHVTGWNEELGRALHRVVSPHSRLLAETWGSWASEIAADAFAFAHTGYASVVGLHDVLAGAEGFVFRQVIGDPHPTSYIRVLLGVEMCRQYYGEGPWEALGRDWRLRYPISRADADVAEILGRSGPLLSSIVRTALRTPYRAFRGAALDALVDPREASPPALLAFEREVGPALYTSTKWIRSSAVKLLAISGLRIAESPRDTRALLAKHEAWMTRLGQSDRLAAA